MVNEHPHLSREAVPVDMVRKNLLVPSANDVEPMNGMPAG